MLIKSRFQFLVAIMVALAIFVILLTLIINLSEEKARQEQFNRMATMIAITNQYAESSGPAIETAKPWTATPNKTEVQNLTMTAIRLTNSYVETTIGTYVDVRTATPIPSMVN